MVKLAKMTKPELYHDIWLPSTCFKNQSLTFHDHTSTFNSLKQTTARTRAYTDSSKTKDIGLKMDRWCYIHQFQFYPFSTFIQHMSFKPNGTKKSESLLCHNQSLYKIRSLHCQKEKLSLFYFFLIRDKRKKVYLTYVPGFQGVIETWCLFSKLPSPPSLSNLNSNLDFNKPLG